VECSKRPSCHREPTPGKSWCEYHLALDRAQYAKRRAKSVKTHCRNGHALSGDNAAIGTKRTVCRTCKGWGPKKDLPEYAWRKQRGLCPRCGDKARLGYTTCESCQGLGRQAYRDNPARFTESKKRCKIENPDWFRTYQAKRRGLELGVIGEITPDEWLAIKQNQRNRCAQCGKKKPLELDHITPLIHGGTNFAFNIQGLCRTCNARKHASIRVGQPVSLFDGQPAGPRMHCKAGHFLSPENLIIASDGRRICRLCRCRPHKRAEVGHMR